MSKANETALPYEALFSFGKMTVTPAAVQAMKASDISLIYLLKKHGGGDWGDISINEALHNDAAVMDANARIRSRYVLAHAAGATTFLVVTLADRSKTMIMLEEEN
jgi:hypothetical protein